MRAVDHLLRLLSRFRYPVSLPENVADALGIPLSNSLTFDEFIHELVHLTCRPTRLKRYMPREVAEKAFQGAARKECFREKSLFSYYFNEGWMEFILTFDEDSRLRRVYLQHKRLPSEEGIEIPLSKD